ncbi:MAG: acylphosphatase [Candidatus Kerfeldbacteria bacterium]|nr:acylphosphatase [Candidatus Kerfeldbacteria bacterium]
MKRLRLTIDGTVQGVGFRWAAQRKAAILGIVGEVRNTPTGSVEIQAEAEEPILQEFRDWCGGGTHGAGVEKIEETWEDISIPSFSSFTIIR